MIKKNIHKKLIKRLLFVWCGLSLICGGAVFYLELNKVDMLVRNLAAEESSSLIKGHEKYINSDRKEHHEILYQKSLGHIEEGHFITIKIYDLDGKRITRASNPTGDRIEGIIDERMREGKSNKVLYHKTHYIEGSIYLHFMDPLVDGENEPVGFFEGVYMVDEETMAGIKKSISFSLLQVVVIILMTTVVLYPVIISINKSLIKLSLDLSSANIGMLEVLGGAIAKRDSDTSDHNYRVTIYTIRLAEEVGLSEKRMQALIKGAFLHDVGKIAISDIILLKPAKLSPAEFEIMKTHVQHGVDIISKYSWLKDAEDVVRCHHEKYSGEGYRDGLKGKNIPINARIFTIADIFDALTSKRPYKEPYSFKDAMIILDKINGSHVDPALFNIFKKIAPKLYSEVNGADIEYLKGILSQSIKKFNF